MLGGRLRSYSALRTSDLAKYFWSPKKTPIDPAECRHAAAWIAAPPVGTEYATSRIVAGNASGLPPPIMVRPIR